MHLNSVTNPNEIAHDLSSVLQKYNILDINFNSYNGLFNKLDYKNQSKVLTLFTITLRKLNILHVDETVSIEYIRNHEELHNCFIIIYNYLFA